MSLLEYTENSLTIENTRLLPSMMCIPLSFVPPSLQLSGYILPGVSASLLEGPELPDSSLKGLPKAVSSASLSLAYDPVASRGTFVSIC